jgi:hypothetical protein
MTGCIVQDAHDARVRDQCEDQCDELWDCFADQNGLP